jgi:hypothetical protein
MTLKPVEENLFASIHFNVDLSSNAMDFQSLFSEMSFETMNLIYKGNQSLPSKSF